MIPIKTIDRLHPTAEAFGKVILLGEHSVVYGHPAIAAGLPQGLRLTAEPLPDSAAPIELEIPAWGIDLALRPGEVHPVAMSALAVLSACKGPRSGWRVRGESSLPARAGLGSSAALTVALARLVLGPDAPVDAVIEASMVGERIFHGQPSGLDSAVAARGGVLRFVRGEPTQEIALTAPIPLLIFPSGVARSTAVEVGKVRARRERLPSIIDPVLGALGAAVESGIDAILRNDLECLGEIMNVSHELLSALDVSAPALDHIVERARAHGAPGAKLTGAGGGGCAIALPPADPAPLLAASRAAGIHPLQVEVWR
ncbi:MAG: mevalonate kinase [Myxococcales bacterium]|nr:mevalonate kinase [Myxococcales bacterium]